MRGNYIYIYLIGKLFAQGSIILKQHGYFSLSERIFNLSIAIHEHALVSLENLTDHVRERRRRIRLSRFLNYVFRTVPFYQAALAKHKIHLDEIRSLDGLSKIPVLTKEEVKAHALELVAKSLHPHHCAYDETSGSTGTPLKFCIDRCSIPERRARLFHLWRRAGVKPHEPTLLISSPKFRSLTPKSIIYLNPVRIHNDFEQTLFQLRSIRPRALRGNPLAVLEFCWLMRAQEIRDVRFEIAILYGQVLTSGMKSFIEETLGCKVFGMYALGEVGAVAGECSFRRGFHVAGDAVIVEIVDTYGNAVPRGIMGQVIVTDLTNYIMPFIRYTTGDRGKFIQDSCPCGRSSPLLYIDGREEEMLICPDGTLVFGGSARDILDRYSFAVERYQIFQEDKKRFIVKLMPSQYFDKISEKNILVDLAKLFGAEASIIIEYVSTIPLHPSGKFKQFISQVWKERFPANTFSRTPPP